MRINNIMLLLSVLLILLIAGFGAALIFKEIPPGNKEVVISLTGMLATALITIINAILKKPKT